MARFPKLLTRIPAVPGYIFLVQRCPSSLSYCLLSLFSLSARLSLIILRFQILSTISRNFQPLSFPTSWESSLFYDLPPLLYLPKPTFLVISSLSFSLSLHTLFSLKFSVLFHIFEEYFSCGRSQLHLT